MSEYWKGIQGDEHIWQHEWSKYVKTIPCTPYLRCPPNLKPWASHAKSPLDWGFDKLASVEMAAPSVFS
jgi:hypothetical protein